ncbi:ras GTPAse, putative [Plasmodium reichenowi]|uniref:Ras GTPAse, putative n=1 Tax=Plasmodium reichenowi TaxID=5854 RepID=A0A151LPE8_PLARE|nr:ras GTPAse, putative [Plasmodium reichenowi]KYO01052.1 ras GTPAse, putative [Plasmodium reichenowi]
MDNFKILVLGDLGVGKSSFLKLISERFNDVYPIDFFDYFIHLDEKEEEEEEKKKKEEKKKNDFVCAKDLASNTTTKHNVENVVETIFFQAKKNFLQFIEHKMNTNNFIFEETHKYTYGFEIYTLLWSRNNEYNNKFKKNNPLNIIKNIEKKSIKEIYYHNNENNNNNMCFNNNNNNNNNTCYNNNICYNDNNICYNDNVYDYNNHTDLNLSSHSNDINNFYIIEFVEIGGIQTYSYIRNIFYEKVDGILLVYDSSNNKSYHNLAKWLYELYINTKPPSDVFCGEIKKKNFLWNFFHTQKQKQIKQDHKKDHKKDRKKDQNKNKNRDHINDQNQDQELHQDREHFEYDKNIYNKYNYDKGKNNTFYHKNSYKRKNNNMNHDNYDNYDNDDDEDFFSDDYSDIEKGSYKYNEDILNGKIPIACVATKIDKKNAKEKPAYVKTPRTSYFYNFFFPDLINNDSVYDSSNNIKIKKHILKKLEQHITEAIEIKASSIDCVVDIESFVTFLKNVYNKKFNIQMC